MDPAPPALPPHVRILQLATAHWCSAAVGAAARLGVADALAAGPRAAADLAPALGADEDALYRLLRACADLDVVVEHEDRVFALTEVGGALRGGVPNSMRGFAMWNAEPAERLTWASLADSVRTGRSAFADVHGAGVWEWMAGRPEVAGVFDEAMTAVSHQVIAPVLDAYSFDGFDRVVDVGGGRGALLAAILAAHPHPRGVLYDQPGVADGDELAAAGVAGRSEVVEGDFFDGVPAGGDAYVLSNILHDWDDDAARRILSRVADAMRPDGRVLLVEVLMPGTVEPAPTVKLMDLDMLVLCDGRQRTEAEFGELLRSAGLALTRVVPGGFCSIVEAERRAA